MTSPTDAPEGLPGFERRDATVDGTRTSFLVGGDGDPVVLLHGWPQTSHAWREVLAPLADLGYTVIAPDLRGTGRSERARDGYAKDDQARALRALLQHLGAASPVRLVGHDIGGMVAFSYARLHPEEVARLALLDLAVPGFGLEEAMDVAHGGLWHFGFFMAPEVPELLLDGHERAFFDWWFQHMAHTADAHGSPALDPAALDVVTRAYSGRESLRCGFEHYRTLLADGATNRSWRDAGGRLTVPVLAVGGEHSSGGRLGEQARAFADDVRTEVVAGSGHFIPEERPDELVALLREFLG